MIMVMVSYFYNYAVYGMYCKYSNHQSKAYTTVIALQIYFMFIKIC